MINVDILNNSIKNLREHRPLVHNITNYVTINQCANITLACGGSPIMADEIEEVEEIQKISKGLNLNLGTIASSRILPMIKAGKVANALGNPVVLDPVGVGASYFRMKVFKKLLEQVSPSVIKGNISEMKALLDRQLTSKGVDASSEDKKENNGASIRELTRMVALTYKVVAVTTGERDYISDGKTDIEVYNGHPMMEVVTGAGCQLSSLIAAFVSAHKENVLEATLAAVLSMGIAGELAYETLKENQGCGTYGYNIIDAIGNMTMETLIKRGRYEIF